jgi:hypothetical protein
MPFCFFIFSRKTSFGQLNTNEKKDYKIFLYKKPTQTSWAFCLNRRWFLF